MREIVIRTLADVASSFALVASCAECGHTILLEQARLAQEHGRQAVLVGLRRRLRCTACGARAGRPMQVWTVPAELGPTAAQEASRS